MLALLGSLGSHRGGLLGSCRVFLAMECPGLCHWRELSEVSGHTWTNSGVLQALARAGRAPWPHGTAVGALQHELIHREWRTEEEEAAGWADADPAKQVPAQTHQNLGQIDFKPMARSVWWCCSSLRLA